MAKQLVTLIVLDGWGIGRDEPGNAVLAADTPVMDDLLASYPHATLRTSGLDVGLPAGQMGNSEVGHLNLGAGFVVFQWISRIDNAIENGEFFRNPVLTAAVDRAIASRSTLHLLGLVSDGGVHSHTRHLVALMRLAKSRGLDRIAVHAFTDGRDTAPTSGLGFATDLSDQVSAIGGATATVSGRYYAMDRDRRWERTKLAYDAIVAGIGQSSTTAQEAIASSYREGTTDEFVLPTVIGDYRGMMERDEIFFFNFRSDRGRQLSHALADAEFTGFPRVRETWAHCPLTTLTRYEVGLPAAVAFEPHDVTHPLARAISEAGFAQYHCAETEKYPHVAFFFNGGREEPFAGEERALVPSPNVATYDLQPDMSAHGVTQAVIEAVRSRQFAFVIVNFANCDMVGHTGDFAATVAAVETVDRCLGAVVQAVLDVDGCALVTADHGNAEEMIDRVTGQPMTAHTTNPVPVVLVAPEASVWRHVTLQDGILSAVAPTVLALLDLAPPPEMSTPALVAALATNARRIG